MLVYFAFTDESFFAASLEEPCPNCRLIVLMALLRLPQLGAIASSRFKARRICFRQGRL